MNTQLLAQQLGKILTQQIKLANELHQTLLDENAALTERNLEESKRLNLIKNQHVSALEKQTHAQRQLFETAGLVFSPDSFDQLLGMFSPSISGTLTQLKTQLEQQLEKGQDQNMINGQIIAINQQTAETAIAILRGQVSTDNENLAYTSGGKTINKSNQLGNNFTKA